LLKGQVVGLIARRSIETTAAILGILKAGGAYLPLDISYPAELLRYICRDSGLSLTLVEQALWPIALFFVADAPLSNGYACCALSRKRVGARV